MPIPGVSTSSAGEMLARSDALQLQARLAEMAARSRVLGLLMNQGAEFGLAGIASGDRRARIQADRDIAAARGENLLELEKIREEAQFGLAGIISGDRRARIQADRDIAGIVSGDRRARIQADLGISAARGENLLGQEKIRQEAENKRQTEDIAAKQELEKIRATMGEAAAARKAYYEAISADRGDRVAAVLEEASRLDVMNPAAAQELRSRADALLRSPLPYPSGGFSAGSAPAPPWSGPPVGADYGAPGPTIFDEPPSPSPIGRAPFGPGEDPYANLTPSGAELARDAAAATAATTDRANGIRERIAAVIGRGHPLSQGLARVVLSTLDVSDEPRPAAESVAEKRPVAPEASMVAPSVGPFPFVASPTGRLQAARNLARVPEKLADAGVAIGQTASRLPGALGRSVGAIVGLPRKVGASLGLVEPAGSARSRTSPPAAIGRTSPGATVEVAPGVWVRPEHAGAFLGPPALPEAAAVPEVGDLAPFLGLDRPAPPPPPAPLSHPSSPFQMADALQTMRVPPQVIRQVLLGVR